MVHVQSKWTSFSGCVAVLLHCSQVEMDMEMEMEVEVEVEISGLSQVWRRDEWRNFHFTLHPSLYVLSVSTNDINDHLYK